MTTGERSAIEHSDTPRTDALFKGPYCTLKPPKSVLIEHARQLEREIRAMNAVMNMPPSTQINLPPAASPSHEAAREYARLNPMGGPAVVFRAMAERIEAGEEFYSVLDDYGFKVKDAAPANVAPLLPCGSPEECGPHEYCSCRLNGLLTPPAVTGKDSPARDGVKGTSQGKETAPSSTPARNEELANQLDACKLIVRDMGTFKEFTGSCAVPTELAGEIVAALRGTPSATQERNT